MTWLTAVAFPLTLVVYTLSKWLYKKYKTILVSPILLAPCLLIIFLLFSHGSYDQYKQGADFISYMLGPATVAFAVPMYKYFHLLKKTSCRNCRKRSNWNSCSDGIFNGFSRSFPYESHACTKYYSTFCDYSYCH